MSGPERIIDDGDGEVIDNGRRWAVGSDEIGGGHCVLPSWAQFVSRPEPRNEESEEGRAPTPQRGGTTSAANKPVAGSHPNRAHDGSTENPARSCQGSTSRTKRTKRNSLRASHCISSTGRLWDGSPDLKWCRLTVPPTPFPARGGSHDASKCPSCVPRGSVAMTTWASYAPLSLRGDRVCTL